MDSNTIAMGPGAALQAPPDLSPPEELARGVLKNPDSLPPLPQTTSQTHATSTPVAAWPHDLRRRDAIPPADAGAAHQRAWLYWQARHLAKDNDHARAAELFIILADMSPGVTDLLHLDAARQLAASAQPRRALAHLDLSALQTPDARRVRARVAMALQDPATATENLSAGLGLPETIFLDDDDCALITQNVALWAAPGHAPKLTRDLARRLGELTVRCANSPSLPDISRRLSAISMAAPAPASGALAMTPEDTLVRARLHLQRAQNKDALKLLTEVSDARPIAPSTACQVYFWRARALRALKQWRDTDQWYLKAADACTPQLAATSPELRLTRTRALYWAGVRAWKRRDAEVAAPLFNQLLKEASDTRYADDALYYSAQIDAATGQKARAARTRQRLIDEFPMGDMTRQSVWEPIFADLKAQRWRPARDKLIKATALPPDPTYYGQGRSLYYLGLSHQNLGDLEAAATSWRRAFEAHPSAFYGQLSAQALMRSPDGQAWLKARPRPTHQQARPLPFNVNAPQLRGLVLLGDFHRASAWRLAGEDLSTEDLWLGAWLAHLAGDFAISHNVARRRVQGWPQLYGLPTPDTRLLWEIAYPDPFADIIERWAHDRDIDPWFVRAIMREESGFDRTIVSWAGAVGLLQLILPTARGNAQDIRVDINQSSLMRPEVNVPIATRFMRQLFGRFGTEPILLACGYNAGPGAPSKWIKKRPGWNIGLFAEAVPYNEARNYSRRVTGSHGIYQWLYSDSPLTPWSLHAPEP